MSFKGFVKKWIVLIIIAAVLIAAALSVVIYTYTASTIHRGVVCSGINLGGMSEAQAKAALLLGLGENPKPGNITVLLDRHTRTINTGEFDVAYAYDKTASSAMSFGREGTFFSRCSTVLRSLFLGHELPLEFDFDYAKLSDATDVMLEGTGVPVQEYSYEIADDKFYITNGTPGDMPDKFEVMNSILETAGMRSFSDKLAFEKETRSPEPIDVDALYSKVSGKVSDAAYELKDGDVVVVPHSFGVEFNKKEVEAVIKANTEYGKTFTIPADIDTPELLEDEAHAKLFSKILGSYKSSFNSGDAPRSSNIRLASKSINGTILMPGDEFSYNGVVGERTAQAGYQIANVYMNNEVASDYGGGICQVSSTLYCAALYSNLQITERLNHQLTVAYVPIGQDATIDWGNIDLKFINTTPYPMKIVANVPGSTIEIAILGYRDVDEIVEITPVHKGIIPPTVVEEKDPTLPLGEHKNVSVGNSGSAVETYKTVTVNGQTGPSTFVASSRYAAGKTVVKVGTMPPEESPPPEETPSEDPDALPPQPETTPSAPIASATPEVSAGQQ